MRLFLALGNVSIVKLSQFYIYCGKVKKELVNIPDIRQKFDYENSSGVTHLGINLEEIAGRRLGECSVVLSSEFLGRFNVITFSKELCNSLSSPKAVVAYSLGDQIFFCASGPAFLEKYGRNYFNK